MSFSLSSPVTIRATDKMSFKNVSNRDTEAAGIKSCPGGSARSPNAIRVSLCNLVLKLFFA